MAGSQSSDGTLRLILIVLAVVVGAPLLLMVVALPMMGAYGGMMGGYGGMMGGYGGYSPLWALGLLFVPLLLLVAIVYFAYRLLGRQGGASADPALEELRLAYARGDLSDEEYETRRENLRERPDDRE